MAYARQAQYGPSANYYDAPRSAPLEPPQEYAQGDYNYNYEPSAHQQAYANDDGYGGGPRQVRQGQHRGQTPLGQVQQQYQPSRQDMGRGGQGQQGGGYEGYGDGRVANDGWRQRPQNSYNASNVSQGYNGGRQNTQGYGPQGMNQGHPRAADPQQGYASRHQEPYQDPHYGQQGPPQSRPAPQRSYSAGAGANPKQHNPQAGQNPGQAPAPHQRGNARVAQQLDLAATPKKKEKKRILQEPESPETLPWDNPFPSFPGVKEKKSAAKLDTSRPQTAASGRKSHESHRSLDGDPNMNSNQYHDQARSRQAVAPSNQRPPQPMQPRDGSRARPERVPQNRAMDSRAEGHGQQMNEYQDPRAMAMSPPQPQFAGHEQRSNTLPNEVSESMLQGKLPLRPHGTDQRLASDSKRRYPPQATKNVLPPQNNYPQQKHQRSNSFDTPSTYNQGTAYANQPVRDEYSGKPNEFARRPSGGSRPSKSPQQGHDATFQPAPQQGIPRSNNAIAPQGSKQAFAQSLPTIHQAHGVPEANYGGVSDSYHDNSEPTNFKPYTSPPTINTSRPEDDEDMPNFDAALTSPTNDKALHIEPQKQNSSPSRADDDPRGRSRGRGPEENFAGQASRSQSQPNIRNQDPRNDYNGFDFGVNHQAPEMPQMNPKYAQQRPNQAYQRSPPSQQYQGEWQQPNNGSFGPPSRSQTDGFGPGPGGAEPMSRPRNGSGPRPNLGSNGMYQGPRPGPGARASPGPGAMGRPPPRNGQLPPPNNSRAVSEGSPRQGSQTQNSAIAPSPVSSPPTNPDALPHHPAPARPGHMQPAQSPPMNQNISARPPPIRQYNGPSPTAQPSIAPPPPQPSAAPVTYDELQRLRGAVQSRPNDQNTQMILARKLVEAASTLANDGGRADPKTKAKNREKYINEAYKMIKRLVGIGNTEAMFYLADCYGSGQLGLLKDPKEAFSLYQSAAKLNHAQSAYRVAVCCEIGLDEGGGTKRDAVKAMQWYQRAATLGDVPAMYKLGVVQLKGLLGQSRNPREAVTWLQKAAERADEDNPHALHELAILYQSPPPNSGIPRDDPSAMQLLTRAADLNYKFSQFKLGQAYEQGALGLPVNARMSIAWYSKAAMQEEHQSELGLSGWYLTGFEGVLQQNDTEAYLWARKAAQAGLAKAEYAMGYFTEVGIGAPADLEGAKRWYWKAASQNFPKARERLEDLRKGGTRIQKTRVSRSAINKPEGECKVM